VSPSHGYVVFPGDVANPQLATPQAATGAHTFSRNQPTGAEQTTSNEPDEEARTQNTKDLNN
jgi:hypothetical protein